MRTKFTQAWLCLLLLNGLLLNPILSQDDLGCTTSRSYEMVKSVRYSISSETPLESVSDYDLISARGYDNVLDIMQCVDEDGDLITSTEFQNAAYNPDSWQPQIFKSIMDKNGVRFYDAEGELLYHSSPQMANAIESESLEISEVSDFGIRDVIPEFNMEAFDFVDGELVLEGDGRYTVLEGGMEVMFDPSQQRIISKLFEEGKLVCIHEQYFIEIEGEKVIPGFEVIRSYTELLNGGWMEKTETRTYNEYTVNGNTLLSEGDLNFLEVNLSEEDKTHLGSFDQSVLEKSKRLKLFPNPAQNVVKLAHPEGIYNIQIYDLLGSQIMGFSGTGEKSLEVSVARLSPGTYIMEVCTPTNQLIKQFVKI